MYEAFEQTIRVYNVRVGYKTHDSCVRHMTCAYNVRAACKTQDSFITRTILFIAHKLSEYTQHIWNTLDPVYVFLIFEETESFRASKFPLVLSGFVKS